jgi:hypothetical protein
MPIDEATYEQLERWLRGELNAEEQAAFELKLAENPELLAEAEWFANTQEVLRDEGRAAMKKLIAGVGAGVSVATLAAYTPTRNVIPKWKAWLKKFWWIPVSVITAGSLVAFLTTANEIVEGELPPLIPEHWLDSTKKDSLPRKETSSSQQSTEPINNCEGLAKDQNLVMELDSANSRIGRLEHSSDWKGIDSKLIERTTDTQIFVDERYNNIVKVLMIDSGYTSREKLLTALKRRKIEVFDTPPVKPAEVKK